MAKAERLFEIIQLLRSADEPVRAADIADALEVSKRTVYRDIANLQARQIPIYGESGIGYVMRDGYDLPPINLDDEEAEAVSVGLSLVARTGDLTLWKAAKRASRKLRDAAPETRRLVTSSWPIGQAPAIPMADLRKAVRRETKVSISYRDGTGHDTERVVWPLVLVYYLDATMLVAWCELRADIRHFRLDRVLAAQLLSDDFVGHGEALISVWEHDHKHQMVPSVAL